MEASVVLIASVTVNVCVIFVLVISWMIWRRRQPGSRGAELEGGLEDGHEESDTHERKPSKRIVNESATVAMDAYLSSDIVMSTFCVGAGLYIITSSSLWQCPFSCQMTSSGSSVVLSPSQHVDQPTFGPVSSALLSAAFGRFIFSISHLIYTSLKFRQWNLWSVVHGGYLCINIIIFGVILATGQNLLGGTLILLMEADVAIEEICQAIDRYAADKGLRKARLLLSFLGCAMSLGTRVALPWVLCLSLGHVYHPIDMTVHSLGVASFGFIFYQAYTLLAMKLQCERIQVVVSEGDRHTSVVNDTIEPYHGKSSCSGRKDVALYLMNEGLIEISSYAKTVAGAITGKKLVPIKSLCDNMWPVKPDSKSIKNKIETNL